MNRRHDIDVLRVFAFSLLIFYHVGMVYVAEWGFHVKSGHQWEWLQWPMVAVNRWRMPLIFLLSGIALGLARPERGVVRFGLRRSWRLLLSLTFGMLAIVPIQAYCEALSNGVIEPGFIAFMARYLQLQPWPEGGFAGAEHGVTWNHLWYLAYLWVYTLILLTLLPLLSSRPGQRLAASRWWPAQWNGMALLLVPSLYALICLYWLEPVFGTTHALTDDWYMHALNFPILVFGYLIARSDAFWQRLERLRWTALTLALWGLTVYMVLRVAGRSLSAEAVQNLPDINWHLISRSAHALYLWTALMVILAFGHRWLNRPFRWLPYANEAVYPWYILHQSLIVPLAFVLAPLALSGATELTLVLGGTLIGCALLHELFIRRAWWLRPLFGLKRNRERAILN